MKYFLRDVLSVFKLQFKCRSRDYKAMAWTILFPLLLVGVFALLFLTSRAFTATIVVVDDDQSDLSGLMVGGISVASEVNVVHVDTIEEALDMLDRGTTDAVLEIPPGLQETYYEIRNDTNATPEYTFHVYYRGEDAQQLDIMQIILEGLAADVNDWIMPGYDGPLTIETHSLTEPGWGYTDLLVPLCVGIVIIQGGVYFASNAIAYLNENSIRKRLVCSPTSPLAIPLGIVLSEGTFTGISATIAAIFGTILFEVSLSGMEFVGVVCVIFVSAYVFAILGTIVGRISKTQASAQAISAIVVFPLLFFSSTFILPGIFPQGLTNFSGALPLGHTAKALRLLFLHNPEALDVLPSIGWLSAWGMFFLTIVYLQERK